MTSAWLDATARALGGPAVVLGRRPLAGGYVSSGVERIDLRAGGRIHHVVLKQATAAEVAASRALAVVAGGPRPVAVGADWLVLPYVDGPALTPGVPVPDDVWDLLARVHAHWLGKRPRALPVVDAAWWARLCDVTLVAVEGALRRTPDPAFDAAAAALRGWRTEPSMVAALALLPRTLVHGDPHRGNVLGTTLIDWGNARVAPPGLDIAVLRAQGGDPARYEQAFAELTRGALTPEVRAVQEAWADVHVHVQYLGFAADHLGAPRVAEMVANAERAHRTLGTALAAL